MSDQKPEPPSTPDEITKKLEEFIKNSLGGQVLFTKIESPGGRPVPDQTDGNEESPPEISDSAFEFRQKPADIKAYLDRFVIRQDDAKKVLATAVCDHYNHARMILTMNRSLPQRSPTQRSNSAKNRLTSKPTSIVL